MLRFLIATLVLAPVAVAQLVTYDFNNLNGSNPYPFTLLDAQDSWSEETFNATNRCGVTATLSHDGTQSLRFQEVGPGFGCDASRINDANFGFPPYVGTETNAYFQADIQVGYWGGSFGLAYDTDLDGRIRGYQPGELGVRFRVGTHANIQLQLIAADGTSVSAPLSSLGSVSGGDWLRIGVTMDLTAANGSGLGAVDVQNITGGATMLTPVPGLQAVPLGLDQTAGNATNPIAWNAVWLHFEGATYGLDNIQIGVKLVEYQVNTPLARMIVDGVVGSISSPATVNLAVGQVAMVSFQSSNAGTVWDVGMGAAPLIPASGGAFLSPDGDLVNIDLADPLFSFLWGGFASPPFANMTLPISFAAPTSISGQLAVGDPTSITGARLSQPVRVIVL